MTDAHGFLSALTIVLCVAGVITVVFQRLHQPVVLGYILAGLLIGPHVPVPVVAEPDDRTHQPRHDQEADDHQPDEERREPYHQDRELGRGQDERARRHRDLLQG